MRHHRNTVEVTVDGQALAEHKVEVNAARNVTECWIPSEEEKEFEIDFKQDVGWTSYDTSIHVFLDGSDKSVARPMLGKAQENVVIRGARQTIGTIKSFKFIRIVTTDEGEVNLWAANDNFGSIVIKVYRVVKEAPGAFNSPADSTSSSVFHELAVKKRKLSHTCGLGDVVPAPTKPIVWKVEFHDPIDKPLHTFIFKYRSLSLLQAMEIVEVSPAPAPSPTQNPSAGPSRQKHFPAHDDDVMVIDDESEDDEDIRAAEAAHLKKQAELAQSQADLDAAKAKRAARKGNAKDAKPKIESVDDEDELIASQSNEVVADNAAVTSSSALTVEPKIEDADGVLGIVPDAVASGTGKKRALEG